MRILFSLIILSFLCLSTTPAIAAEDYSNTLTLSTKFAVDEPAKADVELNSDLGWDWLSFDFNGRFCTPPEDQKFSFIRLGFKSSYAKNLVLKLGAEQDDSYRLFSKGFTYDWRLARWLNGTLAYSDGSRALISGEKSTYYYDWDKEGFTLNLDFKNLSYILKYNRGYREYPEATYYTSLKNSLEQEVKWATKQNNLTLSYQVSTGEYPYDLSYTRAYWKENWDLYYKHDFSKAWQCSFDYSQKEEEKGFKPYINSKNYKAGVYFSPGKISDFSVEATVNDIQNLQNTVYDPDDSDEDASDADEYTAESEEDSLSCLKRKITFKYQADFDWFIGELGFYYSWDDYYDDEKDKISSGLYSTLKFQFQPVNVDLKIAPLGDQIQSRGYYQLTLKYQF